MNELKGPVSKLISGYIKDKTQLEIHIISNEVLIGYILWADKSWFHLMLNNGKEVTVSKNAIAYYTKL
jgi:molybdopterin-binding protein